MDDNLAYVINELYNNRKNTFNITVCMEISSKQVHKMYQIFNDTTIEVMMYCKEFNAYYFIGAEELKNIVELGSDPFNYDTKTYTAHYLCETDEEYFQTSVLCCVDEIPIPPHLSAKVKVLHDLMMTNLESRGN